MQSMSSSKIPVFEIKSYFIAGRLLWKYKIQILWATLTLYKNWSVNTSVQWYLSLLATPHAKSLLNITAAPGRPLRISCYKDLWVRRQRWRRRRVGDLKSLANEREFKVLTNPGGSEVKIRAGQGRNIRDEISLKGSNSPEHWPIGWGDFAFYPSPLC